MDRLVNLSQVAPISPLFDLNADVFSCDIFEQPVQQPTTSTILQSEVNKDQQPLFVEDWTSFLNDIDETSFTHMLQDMSTHDQHAVVEKVDSGLQNVFEGDSTVQDGGNSWKVVSLNKNIVKDDVSTWKITISSRKCTFATERVEPQLYSCISYDMKHEALASSFVSNQSDADNRIIIVRVSVIDSRTRQEVRKNNKVILSSNSVGVLNKDHSGNYFSDMKIKFNSCSYHFDRAKFQFRVSYSFQNCEEPFLVKESSAFMIFARKANNPTSSEKVQATATRKRKRSLSIPSQVNEQHKEKRMKVTASEPVMSDALAKFSDHLTDLFSCLDKLKDESERKLAFDLLNDKYKTCCQ